MLNKFVREVVVVKGKLRHPVAVQRFPNIRFLLPNQPESIFPYHTGLLYGHGIASRSLWMPLTDVTADEDASASMLIIDTETSRRLVKYAVDNRLSCTQMTELFGKDSWALKCGPGKLCFFTQENIHGNVPNVTGKTRVSIDFRIAEAQHGDLLARKIPAGYFHIIPETEEEELRLGLAGSGAGQRSIDNGKQNTFYINNNTPSTFGVPVHLQRYMLNDYCAKNNLNYGYELFELADMAHLPTLQHIVGESKTNVVMYSIFALPEAAADRNTLLETAIENRLTIFFVNEDLILQSRDDLRVINQYLDFAKYGRSRMPIGLPLSNRSKGWLSYLDARDQNAMSKVFRNFKPDLVLHLAALVDVEECELRREDARVSNAATARIAAELSAEHGATLVYISTGGVFDGAKRGYYTEDDIPNPIMVYGATKLDGEKEVCKLGGKSYVVRAGWMVGGGPSNDHKFVSFIVKQLTEGAREIYGVTDKVGTPTYTHDFALNLFALLEREAYGTYHMACKGSGTRFEVAQEIVRICGYKNVEVKPIDSSYFQKRFWVPRPDCEMLHNQCLEQLGINLMRPWRIAIEEYLRQDYAYAVKA
jgi:dTDP-4-dehydrorhamnose reductase